MLWKQQWRQPQRFSARGCPPKGWPEPQRAASRFWLACEQRRQSARARAGWQDLLLAPLGYYGWRAKVRLGQGKRSSSRNRGTTRAIGTAEAGNAAKCEASLDQLWRLGQPWKHWEDCATSGGDTKPTTRNCGPGGRLRQGVGDDWTGLDSEAAKPALELPPVEQPRPGASLIPCLRERCSPGGQAPGFDPRFLLALCQSRNPAGRAVGDVASRRVAAAADSRPPPAEAAGKPAGAQQLQNTIKCAGSALFAETVAPVAGQSLSGDRQLQTPFRRHVQGCFEPSCKRKRSCGWRAFLPRPGITPKVLGNL